MTKLTTDDVLKLARLSRLGITEDEALEFLKELEKILAYVEQLQTVNVDGLKPTNQVTGLTNVTRADEIKSYGYNVAELLNNVPKVKDGQIETKRMIG